MVEAVVVVVVLVCVCVCVCLFMRATYSLPWWLPVVVLNHRPNLCHPSWYSASSRGTPSGHSIIVSPVVQSYSIRTCTYNRC